MTQRPLALLVLSIVLTGCGPAAPGGGAQSNNPCDCPKTEAIVFGIDWLGDGSAANSSETARFGPEGAETPRVQVRFASFADPSGPLAAINRLADRLEEAGLEPLLPDSQNLQVGSGDFLVLAIAREPFAGETSMTVDVRISVDDEDAAEALQPLVDALGTID